MLRRMLLDVGGWASTQAAVGLLILGVGGTFSAQASPYAGEFLAVGTGARSLGMGGAYVALVEDASATYWNPAALPRSGSRELLYMHSERFGGIVNYDSGSIVLRAHESKSGARSAFGVGILMTSIPGIHFTTTDPEKLGRIESGNDGEFNTNDPDGSEGNGRLDGPNERLDLDLLREYGVTVTDREMGVLLSYGRTRAFHPRLSLGGSVKFVRKSIDIYSAWGIGLDLGALWDLGPGWTLGLNVQDATTTFLDWSGTVTEPREYLTPTVRFGSQITRAYAPIQGTLTLAAQTDMRFEDEVDPTFSVGAMTTDFRLGVEYWYRETVALRLGHERIGADDNPFTAGAGFRVKRLSFDYAFRNHSDLDPAHRVSGGVRF